MRSADALAKLLALRPAVRRELVYGPPMRIAGRTLVHVKDRRSQRYYRIGPREHFLLSRMDGTRSLGELGAAYQAQFGKALPAESWPPLLQLMRARDMLATDGAAEEAARPTRRRAARRPPRLVLLHPDALLARLAARVRWMFSRRLVAIALGAIALAEGYTIWHRAELVDALTSPARAPVAVIVAFVAIVYASLAAHELAHGMACKRYDGHVAEMGIAFRYLWLWPYCKLDDLVMMRERRQRLVAIAAGPLVSALVMVPFAVAHASTTAASPLHQLSVLMLTIYNAATLFNLVPFAGMDGYLALAMALDMPELREDAYATLRNVARLRRRRPGRAAPTARERRVLVAYGVASLMFTTAFVALIARRWCAAAERVVGAHDGWLALLTLVGLIALVRRAWPSPLGAGPDKEQR